MIVFTLSEKEQVDDSVDGWINSLIAIFDSKEKALAEILRMVEKHGANRLQYLVFCVLEREVNSIKQDSEEFVVKVVNGKLVECEYHPLWGTWEPKQ